MGSPRARAITSVERGTAAGVVRGSGLCPAWGRDHESAALKSPDTSASRTSASQMMAEGKLPTPRRDHLGAFWTLGVIERWAEREWLGTRPWRIHSAKD